MSPDPRWGAGPGDARRGGGRRGGGRRGDDGGREQSMVPHAEFTSYYGKPILKPPVWKDDIAYYFFLGGLAGGSSLLAAGASITGRPQLRKASRLTALGAISAGTYYLIVDLGRPERFHHMLRVAKPTSPMSMGTWALVAYGGPMGLAAVSELIPQKWLLGRLLTAVAGPAGFAAAALAPVVASYTAVLLSDTAVPAWHGAHEELPFVFTASACASSAGMAMILAPVDEAGPARRLAVYGGAAELMASRRMERRMGFVGKVFHTGEAGQLLKRAERLTVAGALGAALLGRRSRLLSAVSGAALLAGSFLTRLGIFRAGIASAKDPKYTVIPQRERLSERSSEPGSSSPGSPGPAPR